ncbi:MAG: NAD(P)H-hydrate dehydratase [Flavisolibacter sp.]
MQILTAEQIRQWDQYTIAHEPIASLDLMERAATKCVEWIEKQDWKERAFRIFCAKGNNGGDGLAIARMLVLNGYAVAVYILETGKTGSHDFQSNLQRLHEIEFTNLHFLQTPGQLPVIGDGDIIVDALFGTGLNKPLEGLAADIVSHINAASATVVSIDVPSGLFSDKSSKKNIVVEAEFTLSFQTNKLSFLMQENASCIGEVEILDIGLSPGFIETVDSNYRLVEAEFAGKIYRPRSRFAHKGSFGHALIMAGSYGKMGAAVLATKACVKSGAGLTTAFIPQKGYEIMQIAVPEAMVICDESDENNGIIHSLPDGIEKYSAIGIGPGMGTNAGSVQALTFVARRYEKPLVIDADGLNCMAQEKALLQQLSSHSILTPHPKEFDRLFGDHENDFERMHKAGEMAQKLKLVIVLKSHHTLIALPDGKYYFNSTGNAGLAKGGSGDVLTGVITALLAQGYTPGGAAILGVYIHGLSADIAVKQIAEESLTARDLIQYLPKAFGELKGRIKN